MTKSTNKKEKLKKREMKKELGFTKRKGYGRNFFKKDKND